MNIHEGNGYFFLFWGNEINSVYSLFCDLVLCIMSKF